MLKLILNVDMSANKKPNLNIYSIKFFSLFLQTESLQFHFNQRAIPIIFIRFLWRFSFGECQIKLACVFIYTIFFNYLILIASSSLFSLVFMKHKVVDVNCKAIAYQMNIGIRQWACLFCLCLYELLFCASCKPNRLKTADDSFVEQKMGAAS